jgi:RNA polymerase sigma factor (sigma-70 family)
MSEVKDIRELGLEFKETRSERAFVKLYNRIAPGLELYLMKIMRDKDLAGYMLTKTMGKVYQSIDQYKPEYQISTWIYRIAFINACFELRAMKKKKINYMSDFDSENKNQLSKLEYEQAVENMEVDDTLLERHTTDEIADAVQLLPEYELKLVMDRFYEGMDFRTLAVKHGMDVSSAKKAVNKAKKLLKGIIRAERNRLNELTGQETQEFDVVSDDRDDQEVEIDADEVECELA